MLDDLLNKIGLKIDKCINFPPPISILKPNGLKCCLLIAHSMFNMFYFIASWKKIQKVAKNGQKLSKIGPKIGNEHTFLALLVSF